jgi:hypothetical protein
MAYVIRREPWVGFPTPSLDQPDPWDAGWIRYEVESGLIRRVVLP